MGDIWRDFERITGNVGDGLENLGDAGRGFDRFARGTRSGINQVISTFRVDGHFRDSNIVLHQRNTEFRAFDRDAATLARGQQLDAVRSGASVNSGLDYLGQNIGAGQAAFGSDASRAQSDTEFMLYIMNDAGETVLLQGQARRPDPNGPVYINGQSIGYSFPLRNLQNGVPYAMGVGQDGQPVVVDAQNGRPLVAARDLGAPEIQFHRRQGGRGDGLSGGDGNSSLGGRAADDDLSTERQVARVTSSHTAAVAYDPAVIPPVIQSLSPEVARTARLAAVGDVTGGRHIDDNTAERLAQAGLPMDWNPQMIPGRD